MQWYLQVAVLFNLCQGKRFPMSEKHLPPCEHDMIQDEDLHVQRMLPIGKKIPGNFLDIDSRLSQIYKQKKKEK